MKPFQGVIRNWIKYPIGDDFRIDGICVTHNTHANGIRPNHLMHTSVVEGITNFYGYHVAETRNSRYILLGDEIK